MPLVTPNVYENPLNSLLTRFVKVCAFSHNVYPQLEFYGILRYGKDGEYVVIEDKGSSVLKFNGNNVDKILLKTFPPNIEIKFE